ncbi:VHS and GAT domain containing protein [Klebsormidium nitens]|uniref:VHS and GAT domain containing protein n=1 Tax=Klebsormidium nitens TaxID=105231 RepID=A0A1Y1HLQ6_KLENI|nr:VHS and GAT domain containing protein [Klebsormidium nitens]|eukprot:GAQ78923.1 VHS and GAT domain containing protein [Klebsormidium nitens]
MFPSQGTSISSLVEKATSDLLLGPDWGMNMDLCDHINRDPEGGKDVVKAVRKRLHSKNPKVQLLALTVLESCIKNCGEGFHANVAHSKELLPEMVKIVTKKSDYAVRDKILQLLDVWQESFGGARGRYPQFYDAYDQVRRKGIMFPNRDMEHMAPVFTPPATQTSGPYASYAQDAAMAAAYAQNGVMPSMPPAVSNGVGPLSGEEMKSSREAADILNEMLANVDPKDRASVQDELIVDLSEQVRAAQRRVEQFVGSTDDETALAAALTFNDELARVLAKHDAIATGQPIPEEEPTRSAPVAPQQARSYADEEDEDDFARLAHRSSRRSSNTEAPKPSSSRPIPPPAAPRPISRPPGDREKVFDLLSGEYVDAVGSPSAAQATAATVSVGSPVTEAPPPGRLAPPPGRYTETTSGGLPNAPASVRTRPAQAVQQQQPPAAFGQTGSPAYGSPQQTQPPFGSSPQAYQSPSYPQSGQSPPYQQVNPPWAQPSVEPTFKASQPYSPPSYDTSGYNANSYGQQYNQQYNQAPVAYPSQLALPYGGSPVSPLSGGSTFQANESPFDPPSEEKQNERRSSLGNTSYAQSSDYIAQTQRLSLGGNGPRTMTGQPLPQKKEPERRADDIDALFADLVNLKKPQFGGKS